MGTQPNLFEELTVPHFVVVPPTERYICAKCDGILRPPVKQTTCGHRLCKICVKDLLRYSDTSNCPGNEEMCDTLSKINILPDPGTDRDLSNFPAYCAYRNKGCTNTPIWKNLKQHQSECIHRPITSCSVDDALNGWTVLDFADNTQREIVKVRQEQQVIKQEQNEIKQEQKVIKQEQNVLHDSVDGLNKKMEQASEDHQLLKSIVDVNVQTTELLQEEQKAITKRVHEKGQNVEITVAMHDITIAEHEIRFRQLETASYDGKLLWKISFYRRRKKDATDGRTLSLYSQPFHTHIHGYQMCARIYLNGDGLGKGTHLSLFFAVMKGEYDALLQWPFRHKITFTLMDQSGGNKNVSETFRPDPTSSSFRRPTGNMNIASGSPMFVSQNTLENGSYIRDDTLFIHVKVDTSNDSAKPMLND